MNLTPEEQQVYIKEHYPDAPEHEAENPHSRPTRVWKCDNTSAHPSPYFIERWRGEDDIQCECGAWYNLSGQRLRDDWQSNPSNYDSDIGDMEGFEISQLRKEQP